MTEYVFNSELGQAEKAIQSALGSETKLVATTDESFSAEFPLFTAALPIRMERNRRWDSAIGLVKVWGSRGSSSNDVVVSYEELPSAWMTWSLALLALLAGTWLGILVSIWVDLIRFDIVFFRPVSSIFGQDTSAALNNLPSMAISASPSLVFLGSLWYINRRLHRFEAKFWKTLVVQLGEAKLKSFGSERSTKAVTSVAISVGLTALALIVMQSFGMPILLQWAMISSALFAVSITFMKRHPLLYWKATIVDELYLSGVRTVRSLVFSLLIVLTFIVILGWLVDTVATNQNAAPAVLDGDWITRPIPDIDLASGPGNIMPSFYSDPTFLMRPDLTGAMRGSGVLLCPHWVQYGLIQRMAGFLRWGNPAPAWPSVSLCLSRDLPFFWYSICLGDYLRVILIGRKDSPPILGQGKSLKTCLPDIRLRGTSTFGYGSG